jgi:Spy/CpxP family protein refolding chaperone
MTLSVRSRPARATRLLGLVVGATFASGLALAAWAASGDAPPHRPPPMMGMMLPQGPMLDHVLDEANASAAQRAQVHQILDAAAADLKQARPAERADHEQMKQLFSAPVVDAAAVEAVRQRLEARHDAQSRRLTQAMIDVSSVLSVEQRQAIAARMAAHEHGPRHAASGATE